MILTQAWNVLGIAKTPDAGAIRRAYAERLKAMDVDRDVDGYARLREARDAALRWARMQAERVEQVHAAEAQPEEEPTVAALPGDAPAEAAPPPADSSNWLYAAPAAKGEADPSLTTRLGTADAAGKRDVASGFAPAQAPAAQAIAVAQDPFARPVLLGLEPTSDAVMPAWAHEEALHRLLESDSFDEQDGPPPLEGWEEAMALGHLKAILRNAEASSVTAFDATDNWLARTLADAWPRSAPLLEPAAAVFGWESERGQVSERSAVAFLNARLRGMRFREKVQDPKHPLHKAWAELTAPAQQGSRKGWFVKRADVEKLLEGVRKNFPELEHHFDPWRVSLWDKPASQQVGQGWWSNTRLIIFAIIMLVQVLRFAFDDDTPSSAPELPKLELSAAQTAQEQQIVARTIARMFGREISFDGLQSLQPDLAALLAANRTIARSQGESEEVYAAKVHDLVRERIYATALVDKGQLLADVQAVRAGLLRAAQKRSPAACMTFLRTRRMDPNVIVPEAVLAAERKIAVRLLDVRKLGPPARIAPGSASVPGALIEQVMDRTGLPGDRVRQAIGGNGPDLDQCAVTIALIDATLAWKGPPKEHEAILSVL
ncbi:MAG: hypothetical protein VW935_09420 [Novosphingobium sp.]